MSRGRQSDVAERLHQPRFDVATALVGPDASAFRVWMKT